MFTGQDRGKPSTASSIWDALAGLGAAGAGVYLLLSQTADPNSYLQTIAHGIGVYFIAKGIYMSHLLSSLLDRARGVDQAPASGTITPLEP